MKADLHPNYEATTISCACGASHDIRSTLSSFQIDICSECHPFFTGKEKVMDTAGRIDRFNKKYGKKPLAAAEPAPEPAAAAEPAPATEA